MDVGEYRDCETRMFVAKGITMKTFRLDVLLLLITELLFTVVGTIKIKHGDSTLIKFLTNDKK